jgi:hypothetical protein
MDLESLKGLAILIGTFGVVFVMTGSRLMRAIDSLEVELNKKSVVSRPKSSRTTTDSLTNDEPQVCDGPSQVRAEAQDD